MLAWNDVPGHDVIGFDESLGQVPGALWIEKHGARSNVVLRSASLPAACHAAMGGVGIAFIPCFMAALEPTLVRMLPQVIGSRDGFLVVHPDLARVARVRVVMAFLVERFAAEAAWLRGDGTDEPAARPPRSLTKSGRRVKA